MIVRHLILVEKMLAQVIDLNLLEKLRVSKFKLR